MVRFISIITVLLTFGQANALPLDITNIVGGWQNPSVLPPFGFTTNNVPDQGTDTFTWGLGLESEYNFTPGADVLGLSSGATIPLGTFNYINNSVQFPILESIDYSFSFDTNGSPVSLAGLLQFTHTETPDDAGSIINCPVGVEGASVSQCDDFVDVSFAPLSQLISVGADTFLFELLGFSRDGGTTINNSFQTPEGGISTADLYAGITVVDTGPGPAPVPEPGTLALFGLGFLFTGLIRRKLAS